MVGAVTRRWKTGKSEIVGCDGVGDLKISVLERHGIEVWGGSN